MDVNRRVKPTMRFYLLLIIASNCFLLSVYGRSLHHRIRRVAGNDYYAEFDKPTDTDSDYTGEDDYEDYEDYEDYGEMFACLQGNVEVAMSLMCDGYSDCTDGSDEVPANCEEHGVSVPVTTTTSTTTTSTTTTTTTAKALPPIEPSVRKPEDYDYDDACTEEEFQCVSDVSICLPKSQVCDGIHDCPDKEDEENCTVPLVDFNYFDDVIPKLEKPLKSDKFEFTVQDMFDINPGSQDLKSSSFDYLNSLDKGEKSDTHNTPEVQINSRPPILILKPPEMFDTPVFVPKVQEHDNYAQALESNLQQIKLDDYDSRQDEAFNNPPIEAVSVSGAQVEEISQESSTATPITTEEEIEINHETGEVILYKNGEAIRITDEGNSDRQDLPTQQPRKESFDISIKPDAGILKAKKRIEKQGKKLRGIVSELLHHVGKIVETGGSPDAEDLIHTDINVNIGSGADLSVDSLYSRILSGASRPRLSINVKLQL